MKNNLLNPDAAEAIINRVLRLRVSQPAYWGEMNATEMLLHCNLCNSQILTESKSGQKTKVKQLLLRLLVIYMGSNFKKNIRADKRNDTKGRIKSSDFDVEKKRFIQLVKQFPNVNKPLTLTHPAFGNISTREWGVAAYKHMDHHLRQFGL